MGGSTFILDPTKEMNMNIDIRNTFTQQAEVGGRVYFSMMDENVHGKAHAQGVIINRHTDGPIKGK
jgi:hypothetical protein